MEPTPKTIVEEVERITRFASQGKDAPNPRIRFDRQAIKELSCAWGRSKITLEEVTLDLRPAERSWYNDEYFFECEVCLIDQKDPTEIVHILGEISLENAEFFLSHS